jgi:predicted nucleic acid-binding protein
LDVIVFDTSAAIRLFERHQADVVAVVRQYRNLAICAVTVGEFERGVATAADEATRAARRSARDLCGEVAEVVPVDRRLAAQWGALAGTSPRKLSHNDMWILATAASLNVPLCSSDRVLLDVAVANGIPTEPIAS